MEQAAAKTQKTIRWVDMMDNDQSDSDYIDLGPWGRHRRGGNDEQAETGKGQAEELRTQAEDKGVVQAEQGSGQAE